MGLISTESSLGNFPHAIFLEGWDRELNTWVSDGSDHSRLTERGVKFLQRKVESFEEVSCRAGKGLTVRGSEEGGPCFLLWVGGPSSGS